MPVWLYYLRFMWAGVRMLWPGGDWTLPEAFSAIRNEYLCHREAHPDDLEWPEHDVAESLSYWGDC